MHIEIIDRSRTVRIAPTKAVTADSDPFEVMRDLAKGHPIENGQIAFNCDAEFYALCETQNETDRAEVLESDWKPAEESGRFEPGMPGTPPVPMPTFLGAPVIVQPSREPLPDVPPPPSPDIQLDSMGTTTKHLQENS